MKIAVLTLLISMQALPVFAQANEAEVEQFLANFTDALNRRDFPGIGSSWNTNGELISLAGGMYRGRPEVQRFFEQGLPVAYQGATFHYDAQFIRLTDDTHAVVDGVWKVTGGGPAGYPACGIFLFNLSKPEGTWKIDMSYASVPRRGHTAEYGRTLSWTRYCEGLPQAGTREGSKVRK